MSENKQVSLSQWASLHDGGHTMNTVRRILSAFVFVCMTSSRGMPQFRDSQTNVTCLEQECNNVRVGLHIWSVYIPHQPCLMGVEALDLLGEESMAFDPNTYQQLSLPAAMEG